MNNESNAKDTNDEASNATTVTNMKHNNDTIREQNERRQVRKRKRGMVNVILVGTRVSGKCSELAENPQGSNFQRTRD